MIINYKIYDICLSTTTSSKSIHLSIGLMDWNSIWLLLLSVASIMVLINRLHPTNNKHNLLVKLLFGSLSIVSLFGLFYPIEFGLIGVNIIVTIILLVDFFTHNKNKDYDNRK